MTSKSKKRVSMSQKKEGPKLWKEKTLLVGDDLTQSGWWQKGGILSFFLVVVVLSTCFVLLSLNFAFNLNLVNLKKTFAAVPKFPEISSKKRKVFIQ